MRFDCRGTDLGHDFERAELEFDAAKFDSVFADKNNKTIAQTVEHRRYKKLSSEVTSRYVEFLDWPLGKFLVHLKSHGDSFYLRFLNAYGDSTYCRFRIADDAVRRLKGLYVFAASQEIQYIGRCRDSFGKRIDQGYGKIHPKNCFIDGQATNCHLNSLISPVRNQVEFWFCPIADDSHIEAEEKRLIRLCNPPWNIALR
jgi:hypothetical protein